MTDHDLEDRLRDTFASAEPSDELVASARGTAVAAAASRAPVIRRARGRRRALATLAVAGLIAGAGVATAAVVLNEKQPAVPATPATRAAIGESGVLANAPWLFQAEGAPLIQTAPRRPSLRFPPGTTYAEALKALVGSVIADGTLPDEARVAPPLPPGVIWRRSRSAPRLDLNAPAGYSRPEGRILPPVFTIPGWVSAKEAERIGKALAEGTPIGEGDALLVTIAPPALAACQRLPRVRACRLDPPPPAGAAAAS